jgi:hypothetical protein
MIRLFRDVTVARLCPLALIFAVGCNGDSHGGACRPLVIERLEDVGPLSMPAAVTARDGGLSLAVGDRVLWLFGDTFLTVDAADGSGRVRSSTAAWAAAASPRVLDEPLDAAGAPFQLVPYTADEAADNTRDLLNGWALWASYPFSDSAGSIAFFFHRIRRIAGSGFRGEGTGLALLDAGTTVATRLPGDFFARPAGAPESQGTFGAGGVTSDGDGFLYGYRCDQLGFTFECRVARAPRDTATMRASWRFYDGAAWVENESAAAVVMREASSGMSVNYNSHLRCYLAVHSVPLSNAISLRTGPAPTGPWTSRPLIIDENDGILPPSEGTNYLALEHPHLATEDGRVVTIGYSRTIGPFRGEVRLARVVLAR